MSKIGLDQPLLIAFLHNAHNVLKSVLATRKKIITNVNSSRAQDLFRNREQPNELLTLKLTATEEAVLLTQFRQLNKPELKPTIKMLSIIKINTSFLRNQFTKYLTPQAQQKWLHLLHHMKEGSVL